MLAWSISTLLLAEKEAEWLGHQAEQQTEHLVVILDVSPSMRVVDAGPEGNSSRAHQARSIISDLIGRQGMGHLRVSLIAVWTDAKTVVNATYDPAVVRNLLDDLPLHYAFDSGPTRLTPALHLADQVAKPWPADSTSLILLSDGDPSAQAPSLGPAFHPPLIVGLGNQRRAATVDGHLSRQESSSLHALANGLGGHYLDGSRELLPAEALPHLGQRRPSETPCFDRTSLALLGLGIASAVLALLPLALQLAGWPGRSGRHTRGSRRNPALNHLTGQETVP
jgi:Ca-activated chloride channel family protein